MAFCLTQPFAEEFKKRLKNGEIDPQKLVDMTSEERRNYFADFLGEENAKQVNALFESKTLLKIQQTGFINWAKQITGIKPEVQRDLITRIEKMDKILDPAQYDKFLEDLAEKKLGLGVSEEEASKIFDLSKNVRDTRKTAADSPEKQIEYGRAILDLREYIDELNPNKITLFQNVTGLTRSIKVIGDLGVPFRQGWGMITRGEWRTAFKDMFTYIGSKENYRNMEAKIVSDPVYQKAKKSGLRLSALAGEKITQKEEDFMTSLVGKIPFLAGIERANVGFLTKLRFDVFKTLYKAAEMRGENVNDVGVLRDLANVVNDFTGSGNLGKADIHANIAPALNNIFFSARKISATMNMLNPVRYVKGSPTARAAAVRQLLGSLAFTGLGLTIASMMGAKTELDPTSANFGKMNFGKTHIDITGGNGSYAVLLARLFKNQTKSATTGKINKLGVGYKPETRGSLILKFTRNKLAPMASVFADFLSGTTAKIGQKPTIPYETKNVFVPMLIDNLITTAQEDPSLLPYFLFDYFGNSVQTY